MSIIRRDELAQKRVERVSLGGKPSAPRPREKTPEEKQREAEDALRRKADETLASAREQGQREGCAAGREEGLACVREALSAVRAAVERLEEERIRIAGQMERDMTELLMAIADKAFFSPTDADLQRLSSVVKKAVAMLARKSAVTVRVNPNDLPLIEQVRSELAAATDDGDVAFMADPDVASGDCRVVSASGIVEADRQAFKDTLEEQFRTLAGTEDTE
jgi:flagellar biosynthesis/type III secretory pathway protein FliH